MHYFRCRSFPDSLYTPFFIYLPVVFFFFLLSLSNSLPSNSLYTPFSLYPFVVLFLILLSPFSFSFSSFWFTIYSFLSSSTCRPLSLSPYSLMQPKFISVVTSSLCILLILIFFPLIHRILRSFCICLSTLQSPRPCSLLPYSLYKLFPSLPLSSILPSLIFVLFHIIQHTIHYGFLVLGVFVSVCVRAYCDKVRNHALFTPFRSLPDEKETGDGPSFPPRPLKACQTKIT